MRLAILDDYQHVALRMADWGALAGRVEISVFHDTLDDEDALVARLAEFEILCLMCRAVTKPATGTPAKC